jgi:uncharacterized delta-60 repeat protein
MTAGKQLTLATGLIVCVSLAMAPPALAAPGDPDPSFGTDGVVVTDFGGEDLERDVAVDSLGRVVVVGNSEVSETEQEIIIARYTPSGNLDSSFGGGDGFVQRHFGMEPWDDTAAVAVYDDGRVVVAGQTASDSICNVSCEAAVMRLTEDGQLDPSFNGDGVFTSGINFSDASAVTIDASERVVIGEFTEIFRLTEAGLLDPSFDGDGRAPVDNGASLGVGIDASGRIVATDYFNGEVTAVRLLATGAPDPAFDGNGYAATSIAPGSLDYPEALALDPSGRVLIVGQTLLPGEIEGRLFMLRFTASGALDPGFGSSGVVLGDENSWAGDVALDASGRLLVTGFWPSLDPLGSLFRFTPSGSLDPSFGGDGAVLSLGSDIATYPEQRIVAAGSRFVDDSDFSVARYLGGDAPPTEEEPPGEEPPADPPAPPSTSTAPPASGEPPPEANPRVALAAAAGVAPVRGGAALLRLRCRAQAACHGVAKLVAQVRSRGKAQRSARGAGSVVLGRSRFRVPAGKAKTLRIRLNRTGQRLLRRAGRYGLRARLVGRGVRNRTVRLKPKRSKRRNPRLLRP